ncbi:hypothetical protein [Yersinia massiliensis]|uniref:hypothetical protein n=1 Tax=Yersinia massiliensis TaxID=419257 RepID=UPI003F53FA9C
MLFLFIKDRANAAVGVVGVAAQVSQQQQDLDSDSVRENGEVIIGDPWLIELRITDAEQLEVTTPLGVIKRI